ncbi:type II secretion system protein [Rhodoferax sp.]|uniref:type II secretion system protein n=1 Tax=Rhodoferax sp. TaxID=50421 RepID=UPI002774117F|nr:type II secretion system protein [Rhodoferax sp.]
MPHRPTPQQDGFTLLAVIAAMLLLALASNGVLTYVSQQALREREAELLRVGQLYAQAIGAYYEASPGSIKRWPRALEDLVEDPRFVGIKRHLRQVYVDPMTRSPHWGLVIAVDGGLAGVHSLSEAAPIRSGAMQLGALTLPAARRYADWQFVYQPAPASASRTPALTPR